MSILSWCQKRNKQIKKKQTRKRKNKTIFNKTTETQKIKKVGVVDILIKKEKRQ